MKATYLHIAGTAYTAGDCLYLTRSVEPKVIVARWLYLCPPIAAMPVSFMCTREVLAKQFGDTWPIYWASSVAPGAIWAWFSKF